MQWLYLLGLAIGISGMATLDWRHKLAFWYDAKRTIITVAIGTVLFIIWDIFGITLGIFFSGHSSYISGLYLGPEFPIEELIFLAFLCYFTLVVYRLGERRWQHI